MKSNTGIASFVFAQQLRQKHTSSRANQADPEFSNLALCRSPGCGNCRLRLRKRLQCFLVEHLAFWSEPRTSPRSRKEFDAEFVLKISHGLTDRGLRDIEVTRCFAVSLPLHNSREVTKMPKFH